MTKAWREGIRKLILCQFSAVKSRSLSPLQVGAAASGLREVAIRATIVLRQWRGIREQTLTCIVRGCRLGNVGYVVLKSIINESGNPVHHRFISMNYRLAARCYLITPLCDKLSCDTADSHLWCPNTIHMFCSEAVFSFARPDV